MWLQAYKIDPSHEDEKERILGFSDFLLNEGIRNFQNGNAELAKNYYKKALELNENNAEAWYNLGGLYFNLNDTKNGIKAWQNVLKISPGHRFNKDEFSKQ